MANAPPAKFILHITQPFVVLNFHPLRFVDEHDQRVARRPCHQLR
ncbi:hypothetical protein OKW34_000104 [Paraburkholderia youngii]